MHAKRLCLSMLAVCVLQEGTQRFVDFGTCVVGCTFHFTAVVRNRGSLRATYSVGPDMEEPRYAKVNVRY